MASNKPIDEIMSDIAMVELLEKASNINKFYKALGDDLSDDDKYSLILAEFYPEVLMGFE